jgi:hypothetical protein
MFFSLVSPGSSQEVPTLNIVYTQRNIIPDPFSEVWNEGIPIIIDLHDQEITEPFGGKHVSLEVRGVHNGKSIGFLFEWDDANRDTMVTGEGFSDGAALQFPVNMEEDPGPFMGGPGRVNIWFWRGDWQGDLDDGKAYLDSKYPRYTGYNSPLDEGIFLRDIKGGRPTKSTPVEDLVAEGFGKLERQEQQDVMGKGVHKNGRWRVAFIRPMETNDQLDTQFKPGMDSKINFSIWDGADKNRDGQKSVSLDWIDMKIEEISRK